MNDDNDRDTRNADFARPFTRSALRSAGSRNARIHPCPTCKQENKLTPRDVRAGYQCDDCADLEEGAF